MVEYQKRGESIEDFTAHDHSNRQEAPS